MSSRLIDRLVAGAVFAFALVLYTLTVAPTTSFWDAGEFIASVHDLQVMHPPGAPFYMLVGRLASMFAPPDLVALAVNMVSVLASALTVLLTHLVVVRLVQQWQGRPETWTAPERVVALTSGAVGALTFAVSDTFWFNAVEAEVYALSMLFTAAVVWLVMRWEDLARREEATLRGDQHPFTLRANRYLVLIAYLFGLAIGVHLLNLLAFFFIALIFFFIEFDRARWSARERWTGIAMTGAVSAVIFFAIYPGVVVQLPALAEASGAPFFTLAALAVAVGGFLYWTHATRRPALNLVAACLGMILVGYSSYALIFIRSAAEPPIDLNDPDTAEEFISYLKREQYGSTPLLSGVTYDPAQKGGAAGLRVRPRRTRTGERGRLHPLPPPLLARASPLARLRPLRLGPGLLPELPGQPHVHALLPLELRGPVERRAGRTRDDRPSLPRPAGARPGRLAKRAG